MLSIVTITYNDPEALAKTLASLRNLEGQSIAWEHVVVDSSPSINTELLHKHRAANRTHVRQEPRGIYPAMNAGIRAASGDILWFLNAGDELLSSEALKNSLEELRNSASANMLLAAVELTREGKLHYVARPRGGIRPMIGINRICQQAILYRKTLFDRLGMFSEKYRLASDYEFHLRAHRQGAKVLLLNQTIARYDMSGQSSNAENVFAEFKLIHQALGRSGELENAQLHSLVREIEWLRISSFRWLSRTPAGPLLRSFWRTIHRL